MYHLKSNGLENELFRLKASFSHSKDDLISRVAQINNNIYEFLQRAAHVPNTIKPFRPEGTKPRVLLEAKDTADTFYECLQSNLNCNCSSPHTCGVTVSELQTEGQKNVYMRILFRTEGVQTQIKIESADHNTVNDPKASQLQEVTHLRQHVAMKNRVEETRKTSPKSIFTLAAGTLSRNPDTPQWPSKRSRLRNSVRHSISAIRGEYTR